MDGGTNDYPKLEDLLPMIKDVFYHLSYQGRIRIDDLSKSV